MPERRECRRTSMLKAGKLVVPDQTADVDCAVLDVSEQGACLLVRDAGSLPARFALIIEADRAPLPCQLKWSTGNRIGVSFENSWNGG